MAPDDPKHEPDLFVRLEPSTQTLRLSLRTSWMGKLLSNVDS